MPTAAQIRANRRNAEKSTGPRTATGKQRTRMNALKSGIHAESHIIRGENPDDLARLATEYNLEFHPTTPRQRDLVDTVVRNQWQIRRLDRIETEMWDDSFKDHHRIAAAFGSIENRLERLQRRLHAYERSTERALKELHALQLTASEPDASIGFVPSDAPAARPAIVPDPSPAPASPRPEPRPEAHML